MTSILALDQGTTGSTALVIGKDGRVIGRGYREVTQHFPRPGEVEHDPEEIFRITVDAAREAIAQSGTTPVAIGITNQRETVCVWERDSGKPLHKAIVWQDRRTSERCAQLETSRRAMKLIDRTGLRADPYFSATKIEWLLQQVRGLSKRAAAGDVVFGTIDTWLIHRLTGGAAFVTDHTNASRTMLYDIGRRHWDKDLLALFGVPAAALPEIRHSSGSFGETDASHFGHAIPILGVAGDQQAALYGQGCWRAGQAKNTYGTGAFMLLHSGDKRPRSRHGLLATIACDKEGAPAYALEGSVFIAGAAMQWLRDGLKILERAGESEALARSLADTGGVYFVPAFVGLGAPHWDAGARGTIVGLTRGTTRAHIARAALEAMAYSTRDVLDAMTADAHLKLAALQVDGGAAANDWLMQFQADVLGVPVSRPDLVETTALGAAGLAGLAAGVWKSPGAFIENRTMTRFRPQRAAARAARAGLADWRRAVGAALHWASS